MATEKTTKKKKKSSEGSKAGSAVEKSTSSAGGHAKSSGEPEMRSALLPLIWLLIPFIAVVVYGLMTRE
jgi:hypothetical protein